MRFPLSPNDRTEPGAVVLGECAQVSRVDAPRATPAGAEVRLGYPTAGGSGIARGVGPVPWACVPRKLPPGRTMRAATAMTMGNSHVLPRGRNNADIGIDN